MKKLILVLLLILGSTNVLLSQPVQINGFGELLSSLKSGKIVRVIIHYGKCKLIVDSREEKSPDAVGGMDMKTFEFFTKGSVKNDNAFISSSETVLISHPRFGYVFNYIKLRIYDDNSVEIIARYLDPKTYEVKMDETFYTSINNKNNDAAVFLFVN